VINSNAIGPRDHTLIFTAGGGRLGNQLLNYANLLSFSIEHPDFDIINLSFSPYAAEYGNDALAHSPTDLAGVSNPWYILIRLAGRELPIIESLSHLPSSWLRSEIIHRAAKYRSDAQSIIGGSTHTRFPLTGDRYDQFDLTVSQNISQLRSRPISVIAGWDVRAWEFVSKHSEELRPLLQPGKSHQAVASRFIDSLRDKFDILVGALVRQGDYRKWNGGRYFFESSEYYELLLDFVSELSNNNVGILLASDEPQSESVFADDCFIFTTGIAGGDGNYIESFIELSLCDVVVTPPSTFSVSAAFLGDIPVVPLYEGIDNEEWEWLESPLVDSVDHPEMSAAVN
jgi:hypothetical protein